MKIQSKSCKDHTSGGCERAGGGVSLLSEFQVKLLCMEGGGGRGGRKWEKISSSIQFFKLCVSVRLGGDSTRWFVLANDKDLSHLCHC